MNRAASDSGVYIGWFDSRSKREAALTNERVPRRNLPGVLIEGMRQVGQLLLAGCRTSQGHGWAAAEGPVIKPDDRVHAWSIHYSPGREEQPARICVRLDGLERISALRPEHLREGTKLDRFGIFNYNKGGLFVEVYLNDIRYTAR